MIWGRRKRDTGDGADGAEGTAEDAVTDGVAADVQDEAAEAAEAERQEEQAAAEAEEAELARARELAAEREERRRTEGPFDAAELEQASEVPRLDLGAVLLPAVPGMELRLELEERTQRVMGVVVVLGPSTIQLQAFAAPRTTGIWDEIRTDLVGQVGRQGGAAQEVDGPFGTELLARLPVRTEDGRTGHRAVRFVGVDGPRWFLRGVLGGQAALDRAAAEPLEQLLRAVVVVRGAEAMAPRDLLPLQLPPQDQARPTAGGPPGAAEATPGAPQSAEEPAGGAAEGEDRLGPLDPFHRGPEITERR